MSDQRYRQLCDDEVKSVTTMNCCSNAITDCLPHLERRLKTSGNGRYIGLTKAASKILAKVVELVIKESPDTDQQAMIITRMSRLKLQFGHVRKHPEHLVIMTVDDAQTLLAPVLDRCDLECPCIQENDAGDRTVNTAMVKACETRKALKRIGLAEVGLSMDCPYQMISGGR